MAAAGGAALGRGLAENSTDLAVGLAGAGLRASFFLAVDDFAGTRFVRVAAGLGLAAGFSAGASTTGPGAVARVVEFYA